MILDLDLLTNKNWLFSNKVSCSNDQTDIHFKAKSVYGIGYSTYNSSDIRFRLIRNMIIPIEFMIEALCDEQPKE